MEQEILQRILGGINRLNVKTDTLQEDVNTLKEDVRVLKEDVKRLDVKTDGVEKNLNEKTDGENRN